MFAEMDRRVVELRFIQGIEKVEHVPYGSGDEFWVRFNEPLDLEKLQGVVKKHGYSMVRFAGLPSKLPVRLAEVLWNGVSFVIGKNFSGLSRLKSSLGIEPDGIAKIAKDLHGPYQIFIATDETGIQLLYEYLGMKYVAPTPPPPKPAASATKVTPAPEIQKPATQPAASPIAKPSIPNQPKDQETAPIIGQSPTVTAQQPTTQLPQPSIQPPRETKPVQQPQATPTPEQNKTSEQTPMKKDTPKPATDSQS